MHTYTDVYTHIYMCVYVVCKHLNAKVILCSVFVWICSVHMIFRLHKQTICSSQYTFRTLTVSMGMHVYSLKQFFTILY